MKNKLWAGLTALTAVGAIAAAGAIAAPAPQASAAETYVFGTPVQATGTNPMKINVMGVFAHPDDEASLATPCGVWHDLYGIECGIIMLTRGEGGSNSVGDEASTDLGLRRENEDRTSHYRSGTINVFNIDRVDFYYNLSAPLTEQMWDAGETLRRVVRVIRETQPEILISGSPGNPGANHGNHQMHGRMAFLAAEAAADPAMFPEQLSGLGAVQTWQVAKIVSSASAAGASATTPNCLSTYTAPAGALYTVAGTWNGYASPYQWLAGNLAGVPAGAAKTWAQVGQEGGRAHATQARSMVKNFVSPSCNAFQVYASWVPMQPNGSPASKLDDALFLGATEADPGGLPLGSLYFAQAPDYYVAPGQPIDVTVTAQLSHGAIAQGAVSLELPAGWSYDGPKPLGGAGGISAQAASAVTFAVTPAPDAALAVYRVKANFDNGAVTAYNETQVSVVAPVTGKVVRNALRAEYDQWAAAHNVHQGGESAAVASIGAGESQTVAVEVSNRSSAPASGTVELAPPPADAADFDVSPASWPFAALPAGASTTVTFTVTHTDPSFDPGEGKSSRWTATTAATTAAGASVATDSLTLSVVPVTAIYELASAPDMATAANDLVPASGLSLAQLNIGNYWEGGRPDSPADFGGDAADHSTAAIGWTADAIYAHFTVVDDVKSAAATPARCFGHWLVDSVEFMIDPRGDGVDAASSFKLGIFPFTDDAANYNGNGANGPCWSRDADNWQGFSTGPLSLGNAEGVQVAASAAADAAGNYTAGRYTVKVKVPFAALPAAAIGATAADLPTGLAATNVVDPGFVGLNVAPYDSDAQTFIGSTRDKWSGNQADPVGWGHAYLVGYSPPPGQPVTAPAARVPETALKGVDSPQTIFQSAARGGTISGVQPSQAASIAKVELAGSAVKLTLAAQRAGSVHAYLWKGETGYIPVWTSSCPGDVHGFEACDESDGAAPPWQPDMGGHVLAEAKQAVGVGTAVVELALDAAGLAKLGEDVQLLVSYEEAAPASGIPGDGVNAFAVPMALAEAPQAETPPGTTPGSGGSDGSAGAGGPSTSGSGPAGAGDGGKAGGKLPLTGSNLVPLAAAALLLTGAGAVSLALRRRRSAPPA
ncbi:MAG: PIG-L family deacetylase [Bifidobacteriaceae bacterium]|jgi:LmbE family N-acetylglucosaminyl deacetylase|nr:PIG-L family deacetylase [Bifidobacteriaceae bacterium]